MYAHVHTRDVPVFGHGFFRDIVHTFILGSKLMYMIVYNEVIPG